MLFQGDSCVLNQSVRGSPCSSHRQPRGRASVKPFRASGLWPPGSDTRVSVLRHLVEVAPCCAQWSAKTLKPGACRLLTGMTGAMSSSCWGRGPSASEQVRPGTRFQDSGLSGFSPPGVQGFDVRIFRAVGPSGLLPSACPLPFPGLL